MPHIQVADRQVYYELHESTGGAEAGEATPLVLITGVSGSCRGWLPLQVPEFSKTRPTLIFDHRGAGESDDPGGSFSTEDLARDTCELLDVLELPQVDVLGAFMGGMVAQHMSLSAPERIRKLALVGTYARPDAKRRMLLEDWAALARSGSSVAEIGRRRLLWTLQDETLEQSDLIESMLDFFQKQAAPVSEDLFRRQCEACLKHDTLERLGEVGHPTLILCGAQDQLTPPKFHRELAKHIGNSHLVVLSYGAHLVMAESAERFNETVLQFLGDRAS